MRTIKLPEMTHRMEVIIRPRPGSKEYAVEIHKRDSFYKSIYLLQGFAALSSLEVDEIRLGIGLPFDEKNPLVMSAGKFYGKIKNNKVLERIAENVRVNARIKQ